MGVQVRREGLKLRGIDSVQGYFDKRAALVHYLTHDWIRLTVERVDRANKNQKRAATLQLWIDVQEALKAWAGEPGSVDLSPLPRERADVRQLFKQAAGCIRTAASHQGKGNVKDEALIEYAMCGLWSVQGGVAPTEDRSR